MKFIIGHSAYSDLNSQTIVKSKAAAVRELRARGATRDRARSAVNDAASGMHRTVRAGPLGSDVVEIIARKED